MRKVMVVLFIVVIALAGCADSDDGDGAEPLASPDGSGIVSVAITNLEGDLGTELGGVLLSEIRAGGTAVAGFAVRVDSDPFSTVEVLGNVSVDVPDDLEEAGLWPWPSGLAVIPPGAYTLRVAIGNDYCCYNRWLPAATAGLRLCDMAVTITGRSQVIEITDIPPSGDGLRRCNIG